MASEQLSSPFKIYNPLLHPRSPGTYILDPRGFSKATIKETLVVCGGRIGCNASQTGTAVRNTWRSCSATDLGPVPRISDSVGVGWDRGPALLSSSQVRLLLLAQEHQFRTTALRPSPSVSRTTRGWVFHRRRLYGKDWSCLFQRCDRSPKQNKTKQNKKVHTLYNPGKLLVALGLGSLSVLHLMPSVPIGINVDFCHSFNLFHLLETSYKSISHCRSCEVFPFPWYIPKWLPPPPVHQPTC